MADKSEVPLSTTTTTAMSGTSSDTDSDEDYLPLSSSISLKDYPMRTNASKRGTRATKTKSKSAELPEKTPTKCSRKRKATNLATLPEVHSLDNHDEEGAAVDTIPSIKNPCLVSVSQEKTPTQVDDVEDFIGGLEDDSETPLTSEPCANAVLQPPSLLASAKQPKNFDFLFNIWGLSSATAKSLFIQKNAMMEYLKNFIVQGYVTGDKEKLISFLKEKPEEVLGKFVVAVILLEFCMESEMSVVFQLCCECEKENFELVDFVKTVAIFIAQRAIEDDEDGEFDVEAVPVSLFDNLKVFSDKKPSILIVEKIYSTLMDFIEQENHPPTTQLTIKIWSNIAKIATFQRIFSRSELSFTNLIIESDLEQKLTTTSYLKVIIMEQDGSCHQLDVHFHKAVVDFYAKKSSEDAVELEHSNPILSKQGEIGTLKNLLYKGYLTCEQVRTPRITLSVFEMAKRINIADIWKFLFQEKKSLSIWHDSSGQEQQALVYIASKLKLHEFLRDIGPKIDILVEEDLCWTHYLHGFGSEDVNFFFHHASISIDQIHRYYLLLHWAFHACQKQLDCLEKITFHADVKAKFDQVSSVLSVEAMNLATLNKLFSDRYYSRNVLYKAMKILKTRNVVN